MNLVEIRGKCIYSIKDKIIYPLGNHNNFISRLIRKTYWRISKKYLWGILNWIYDFEKYIYEPIDKSH